MRGRDGKTTFTRHQKRCLLSERVSGRSRSLLAQQRQKSQGRSPGVGGERLEGNRWHQDMEQSNVPLATDENQGAALNALELAKENGRLRRENEALLRQREILKKAISIFSAENPIGGSR